MGQDSNDQQKNSIANSEDQSNQSDLSADFPNREAMRLIPWKDIWSSLKVAKSCGNGEMIEVFYDTLFKEAVFDDNGAWAWDINKRN